LRFIQRARGLGFSIKEVGDLLTLWHDKRRASHKVKAMALGHITEIDQKMAELAAMRRTLSHLANACHGDHRPDCPILDDLAGEVLQKANGKGANTAR
jgi:MerR family transcriptional regulator, copper efflux regulator